MSFYESPKNEAEEYQKPKKYKPTLRDKEKWETHLNKIFEEVTGFPYQDIETKTKKEFAKKEVE